MPNRTPALAPGAGHDEQVWIAEIDIPREVAETVADYTSHSHRQYIFVYAGHGKADLDGWRVPLIPGDVLFIPSRTTAHLAWQAGARAFWIGIADDFLMSKVLPALDIPFSIFRPDFNTPKKIADWTGPAHQADRSGLWNELAAASRRLGMVGNAVVAAYVLMILFENNPYRRPGDVAPHPPVNARNVVSEFSPPSRDVSIVVAFRSLLEQHLLEKWSVKNYYAALNLQPIELVNACKKVLGCPPSELISDRLLLEAKRQLVFSKTSSAVIAYDLGFSDAAYFSRFFKRQTGVSPSEFRRRRSNDRTL